MKLERHRPCENPECRAVDSTKCAFRIAFSGRVHKNDLLKARLKGCRVARFSA